MLNSNMEGDGAVTLHTTPTDVFDGGAAVLSPVPVACSSSMPAPWKETLGAIEQLDEGQITAAMACVRAAWDMDSTFVPLLLLARHLALNHPRAFDASAGTNAEKLQWLVDNAGPAQRREAVLFKQLVLEHQSDSATALFVAALVVDRVEGDTQAAIAWYMQAAALGSAAAQFNLGYAFRHGVGVPADAHRAAAWYAKAANAGNLNAQNNLALMHLDGLGVRRSTRKALKLLQAAADQGSRTAANNLCVLQPKPHHHHHHHHRMFVHRTQRDDSTLHSDQSTDTSDSCHQGIEGTQGPSTSQQSFVKHKKHHHRFLGIKAWQ